jgi:CubicO group peptidase (beta-lactamase class C family)
VVYSCIGFIVLGLMLARIADEDLDSLFRREVLKVVGLEGELGFLPDPATHSLASGTSRSTVEIKLIEDLGYDQNHLPPTGHGLPDDGNARFLGGIAGNAGLFGTVRAVGALASEYLPGGGSLLSSEEAAAATVLRTGNLEQGRGWGWQIASKSDCSAGPALSAEAFGHTGFTGVSVWCEPQTSTVLTLLTNRNHPAQRENNLHPLRRAFHRLAVGAIFHT